MSRKASKQAANDNAEPKPVGGLSRSIVTERPEWSRWYARNKPKHIAIWDFSGSPPFGYTDDENQDAV